MSKIWLPISYGGRTMNVLIPYAHNMDESQLHDTIQWQEEKTLDDLKKLPPLPERVMSKKDVALALKEYMKYLERR